MAFYGRSFALEIIIFIFSVFAVRDALSQTIGAPPANITMKVGSPAATFNCTGLTTDTITWYLSTPKQTKLFTSPSTFYGNAAKYTVSPQNVTGGQSYSLTVNNLDLTDGDSFGCDRTSQQIAFGHLVVIQTPTASVQAWSTGTSSTTQWSGFNPPTSSSTTTPSSTPMSSSMSSSMSSMSSSSTMSSMSSGTAMAGASTTTPRWLPWVPNSMNTGLNVGSTVSLSCQVVYSAPTADLQFSSPIAWTQDPQLSLFFGSVNMTPSTGPMYQALQNLTHIKNITVNYTIQSGDAGSMLGCFVTTVVSSYNDSYNMSLNINGPTTAVTISPMFTNSMNNTIQLGSNFTCSANGYPPPYVVWVPLMSNLSISDGQRNYGNATLLPSTAGQASWNCTALSQQTGLVVAWQTVNFTVVSNATIAVPADDNALALGIGIGVGVGVAVLILIIIIIVCCVKRKRSGDMKSSKPLLPTNSSTSSTAASKGPTAAGSLPKKQQPPVSQNPNPYNTSHNAPLLADQSGVNAQPVRESPGYADLGVRTIGGGGSIPVMNDSFDSANRSFQQGGANPPAAYPRNSGASGAPSATNGGRLHSPSNHSSEV